MKRVVVLGNGGSGKSTLSRHLAEKTGLPLVHLDHLLWEPGWVQRDRSTFDRLLDEVLEKDRWIIDGNYIRTLPRRLERADTVIFLDMNRWICTSRILKRWLFNGGLQAEGCPHKVDWPFFKYVFLEFNARIRNRILELKEEYPRTHWITLGNRSELTMFLRKKQS